MSSQSHTVAVSFGQPLTEKQIERGLDLADRFLAQLEARQALARDDFELEKAHRAALAERRAKDLEANGGDPPTPNRLKRIESRIGDLFEMLQQLLSTGQVEQTSRDGFTRRGANLQERFVPDELGGHYEGRAKLRPIPVEPRPERGEAPEPRTALTDARGNPVV